MITYRVCRALEVIEAADIALKNRLYVSGWELSRTLKRMRAYPDPDMAIIIAYESDIPVGVSVLDEDALCMVFVKKSKRRQGIGTAMIERIKRIVSEEFICFDQGIKGSDDFWDKLFPVEDWKDLT